MLITRSDDGYFGLRRSLDAVFDKAVSSSFDTVSKEHGLTEEGKTVAPFSRISFPKVHRPQQRKYPIFSSFDQAAPPFRSTRERSSYSIPILQRASSGCAGPAIPTNARRIILFYSQLPTRIIRLRRFGLSVEKHSCL